jgi:hypothetical protein
MPKKIRVPFAIFIATTLFLCYLLGWQNPARCQKIPALVNDTAIVISGPLVYNYNSNGSVKTTGLVTYVGFLKTYKRHIAITTEKLKRPLEIGEQIEVTAPRADLELWDPK